MGKRVDNSPRWDFAVRAGYRPSRPYRRIDNTVVGAAARPRREDYDLYMYLVEQIVASGYTVRLPGAPFAVYDALFNAIWYRSAADLDRIAEAIGAARPVGETTLRTFRAAYRDTLWHEATAVFRDFDLLDAAQIPVDTVAGLGGIYGGLVDAGEAATMLARYRLRSEGCRMIPSTPPDEAGFDPVRYWRGPVWVNTNWLLVRELEALGLRGEALAPERIWACVSQAFQGLMREGRPGA